MRTLALVSAGLIAVTGCARTPSPAQPAASTPSETAASGTAETEPATAPPAAPKNVLLAEWTGPYGGVPPWDQVKPELFAEAFETAIAERKKELQAIASDTSPPTFANTIEAMERAGKTLDRVETLFGVMTSNLKTPEYQKLDLEWAPKLAAALDEIFLDPALFRRIEAVYQARDRAELDPVQLRLLTRTYDLFVRSGAKLDPEKKKQLSAINQQLATLFTEFGDKVLADENTWVVVDKEADLAGLPDSVVAAAKAAAAERGLKDKWVIVNTRSAVDPFLTFSTRRDLREKVWRAFVNRGDNGDAKDTNATIAKIVELRAARAQLLGYPSHAHWRMQDTMARDPKAATALMMRVWPAAKARVKQEVKDMRAIARKSGARHKIEPWDYRFYAEKVRKAKYDLDQADLKPYFQLDKMTEAAFWAAGRLYGFQFKEITGKVPVFHPDVRVWEVTDKGGRHVGLFYADNYARTGKRSGAWMNAYRLQQRFDKLRTPIVSNNNNFTKGESGKPVLISLDDANTLFHEFGHALHYLLNDVRYPSLATTQRDFVEFPSQVNENWLLTREVLDRFARHVETGKPMPKELLDKIERSQKFNQGFATTEYLASAIVDMRLHTRPDGKVDSDRFERDVLKKIGMPREIVMRHRLPHFLHLFTSDSYSAGYYSYLWSETMDADTWKAFEEAGSPWHEATAQRLRKLFGSGNETDRAEAYRAFRGRDPDVKALLEKRGFPTK